jgi:hypothetical protein
MRAFPRILRINNPLKACTIFAWALAITGLAGSLTIFMSPCSLNYTVRTRAASRAHLLSVAAGTVGVRVARRPHSPPWEKEVVLREVNFSWPADIGRVEWMGAVRFEGSMSSGRFDYSARIPMLAVGIVGLALALVLRRIRRASHGRGFEPQTMNADNWGN